MYFYDAHNHLQDKRLTAQRSVIISEILSHDLRGAVVNGTQESDWEDVAALSREHPWIVPSFGLHPWFVGSRSPHWFEELQRRLEAFQNAVIGEIGLDRWIQGHDIAEQTEVFKKQLLIAAHRNLPVTIHCLKAWGALSEVLRDADLPSRGFLLHAYSGSAEMARGFVERGAYFSFSTYFLHDRKEAQRELFRGLPEERLLVETDAPDMVPPLDRAIRSLKDPESGKALNHPMNLVVAYEELARIRGTTSEALAPLIAENFQRLFGAATGK